MASIIAALALLALTGLAFLNGADPAPQDRLTFLLLGLAGLLALFPPLQRKLHESRDAATFALIAAGVVVLQVAMKAGPSGGWALTIPILPDDSFSISYALRLVVLAALVSLPAWWKEGGPERYIAAAVVLVGFIGTGIFRYLSHFYKVGATEVLDPTPMVSLYLQGLAYVSLALVCRAATASPSVRRWCLVLMPPLLLALWARHTFMPAPVEVDE